MCPTWDVFIAVSDKPDLPTNSLKNEFITYPQAREKLSSLQNEAEIFH